MLCHMILQVHPALAFCSVPGYYRTSRVDFAVEVQLQCHAFLHGYAFVCWPTALEQHVGLASLHIHILTIVLVFGST